MKVSKRIQTGSHVNVSTTASGTQEMLSKYLSSYFIRWKGKGHEVRTGSVGNRKNGCFPDEAEV